ncbi:hypothetical protein COY25_00125 [Candidatus Uhrbacteria bacterium CG_4_10_14_0_2_um_filter_41_7]|uniref:O-antigen ligase-related domain-containing protein n=1 Tax=Candidatus Uhrbacteria bacterium CG_4_9_14_3_um_filter_41_35 TaxID=1975034 RepID=A0A2M7XGW3_9BACT|nr:MAG: hypothetical protein COV92_02735 [Candidatus Uhrbacteria bacterium CG11_big_fil_rev_8_21_14_0_20_41_9]PIZ55845.1 MAG: hypothetical protein COY25_00125 [Candidatus Uhrbacteria bacterium CG_4_10_14_0_2_um_filter_41_7]PJA47117.1 MAG: hypothetical protein CO173_00025 [Candidatus Uhrbacteria bacterium CG_4_9_14_3_um_filter_41_35]
MISLLIIALLHLFALLTWRNFQTGVILLTGLLPTYLLRFNIGLIPVTVLEVMILIVCVIWFLKEKNKDLEWRSVLQNNWLKAIILLLISATVAVIIAPDKLGALGIWKAYFVQPILIFLLLQNTLRVKDWRNVFKALASSSLAVSTFAIGQYLFNFGIPAPWDIERRVTSIFDYPNAVGLFLAPIVGMSLVLLFNAVRASRKFEFTKDNILWLLSIILGFSTIILAKTEAALVAIPTGLILTFLFSPASQKLKLQIFSASILAVTFLSFTVPAVREKLFLQDYSGQVRLSQWQETAELLKHSPALGVGLNSYPTALQAFHDATFYEIFQYPHNIILNIWVELGLLGLVSFFWLTSLSIKSILLSTETDDVAIATIKSTAFGALAIMCVHGLVDVPFFKNDLAVMTLIFLAALSLTKPEKLS